MEWTASSGSRSTIAWAASSACSAVAVAAVGSFSLCELECGGSCRSMADEDKAIERFGAMTEAQVDRWNQEHYVSHWPDLTSMEQWGEKSPDDDVHSNVTEKMLMDKGKTLFRVTLKKHTEAGQLEASWATRGGKAFQQGSWL